MARWEEGTNARLSDAALGLFATQGVDRTTVEEIAARAGVTARTFFRHFADKEEVLFSGDASMEQFLVRAVSWALVTMAPRDAVLAGLRELAGGFEPDRTGHVLRAAVLGQHPRLRGRQLLKQERWAAALVTVLELHGVEPTDARVAVGRGALAFSIAYDTWLLDGSTPLLTLMADCEGRLD